MYAIVEPFLAARRAFTPALLGVQVSAAAVE
jgi:hypothetical protein